MGTLQKDLDIFTNWSNTWLLRFHPDKCKHMHIGRPNPDYTFRYTLMGKDLEQVESEKDIGVIVDIELSFDRHISEKFKKATSMFAVIRRIFNHLNEETFIPLYKSLVRTHLDYASSVWAPYRMKHVEFIEGVQRRATNEELNICRTFTKIEITNIKLPESAWRHDRIL